MGEQVAPNSLTPTNRAAVQLQTYDASSWEAVLPFITGIYADVYAEPPYKEGAQDVSDFATSMPYRAAQRGFRLIVASSQTKPIGFAFGHQLPPDTKWWQGFIGSLPEGFTRENSGRTFAIIEIAVLREYRRRGIARSMHDLLLGGRPEERVTLLVRPEAEAANAAYARWGYSPVGAIRPAPTAPLYTAMVMPIKRGE